MRRHARHVRPDTKQRERQKASSLSLYLISISFFSKLSDGRGVEMVVLGGCEVWVVMGEVVTEG